MSEQIGYKIRRNRWSTAAALVLILSLAGAACSSGTAAAPTQAPAATQAAVPTAQPTAALPTAAPTVSPSAIPPTAAPTITSLPPTAVLPTATSAASASITHLYAFGDSYSDNGNALKLGTSYPLQTGWQGRPSNGPVAIEVLAARLNVPLSDYAVGGAKSGFDNFE